MYVNAKTKKMEHIEIFGKPALCSYGRIDRNTVPQGWFCYDLRGSDYDPGRPITLEDHVVVNYAGSVLSPNALKEPTMEMRKLRGTINYLGEEISLMEFCVAHKLNCPCVDKTALCPATQEEAPPLYEDEQLEESTQKETEGISFQGM